MPMRGVCATGSTMPPAPTATPPDQRAPAAAQKFSTTEKDGAICFGS